MAELITILLFLCGLLVTIVTNSSSLIALTFGLICFIGYALYKKHSIKSILKMLLDGVKTVKMLLLIFAFIGMLTAVWRSGGTIAYIIYNAVSFVNPKYFIVCTFLLCSIMSFVTGTSFGTVGTMGVVCMTIAKSIGINPVIVSGAVLSGIYFGDRCSPMSSSALLVCEITETDIYKNIKLMVKTSLVPFILTCILYVFSASNSAASIDMKTVQIYNDNFNLSLITLIPAILIVICSIFKVNVKVTMISSILTGVISSLFIQNMSLAQIVKCLLFGYESKNADIALLLNGGGIFSMIDVALIVMISSTYYTLFNETGLLNSLKDGITKMSNIITPFGSVALTGLLTNVLSCNQTLATLLTCQMNDEVIKDKQEMAIALENTAVIMCALVPWSIAAAVPLATIGAPSASLLYAFYLYLIPLWNFLVGIIKTIKDNSEETLAYSN